MLAKKKSVGAWGNKVRRFVLQYQQQTRLKLEKGGIFVADVICYFP